MTLRTTDCLSDCLSLSPTVSLSLTTTNTTAIPRLWPMTTRQPHPDPISQARQWLEERGIPFKQTSEYQLKIGRINFYPGKGTSFRDGDKARYAVTGLKGLIELLTEDGFLPS